MEVDTAKIICLVALFVSTWLLTCAPYFLITVGASSPGYARIRDRVISYLKCFSGGIFMAVCFQHLIPEGMEAMEEYFDMIGVDTEFPAFMCIAALGFFIIASVELFAHSLIRKPVRPLDPRPPNESSRSYDVSSRELNKLEVGPLVKALSCDVNSRDVNEANEGPRIKALSYDVNSRDLNEAEEGPWVKAVSNSSRNHVTGNASSAMETGDVIEVPDKMEFLEMTELGSNDNVGRKQDGSVENTGGESVYNIATSDPDRNNEIQNVLTALEGNQLRAFLLLAALSFHTVFDGLAIGLETTQSAIWEVFTAVIIHKCLVAIGLGLQLFLYYKDRPRLGVMWSLFFATVAPVGLGIGMALSSSNIDKTARHLVDTFLEGLAAGTFLYVTFFEILKEEIVDKRGFKRLILVALGFGVMGVAKYFFDS